MKAIDRLIIKAKKKRAIDRLVNAFIYPSESEPGKWVADGRIWNGKPGSGTEQIITICASMNEAKNTLHELGEQYPNHKDVRIFINDLNY